MSNSIDLRAINRKMLTSPTLLQNLITSFDSSHLSNLIKFSILSVYLIYSLSSSGLMLSLPVLNGNDTSRRLNFVLRTSRIMSPTICHFFWSYWSLRNFTRPSNCSKQTSLTSGLIFTEVKADNN